MLRRLRGRFGISAPQVAVRTHVPWYLWAAGVLGVAVLMLALAAWAYDAGRLSAGFDQHETGRVVGELRLENAALVEEVARLNSLFTASQSNLQIEQVAQKQLSEKNIVLAEENARLKEDLAVFEKLSMLEGKVEEEVSLDRLSVKLEALGLYRYSFLIALQGPRRGKESRFDLQVLAFPKAGSPDVMMALPRGDKLNPIQSEIVLRNFRRIDGKLEVPRGYVLGAVEIRILEAGKLIASKRIAL